MNERSFFYKFSGEEVGNEVLMDGKYRVKYDTEDGRVYGIKVNVGLDFPQIWENIDLPSASLYQACENDLAQNRVVI